MSSTRRRFLQQAAATGAVAYAVPEVLVPAEAMAAPAKPRGPRPIDLRRRRFLPLVGKKVTLTSGRTKLAATLVAVSDLPGAPAGDDQRFSLLFAGPLSPAFPAGVLTVSGPRLTATPLFVVPVALTESQQRYEAVVNRI